jgi:hypothetical protein
LGNITDKTGHQTQILYVTTEENGATIQETSNFSVLHVRLLIYSTGQFDPIYLVLVKTSEGILSAHLSTVNAICGYSTIEIIH